MEEIPGLVICQVCDRGGPGVDELIALPDELEVEAIGAGWRFKAAAGWMCPACLREQAQDSGKDPTAP